MSCSACATGIEKAVKKLNGVKNAEVSLMAKSLQVEYDQALLQKNAIISAVEKLGYGITDFSVKEINNLVEGLKKRFIISLFFLLPLMYFSMGEMIGLPVPPVKINLFAQFLLALAIILINKKFYISGVRAVINLSPNMDTLVSLGSFASLCYSVVVTVLTFIGGYNIMHAFYEASAMVLVLVTLGKWLEEISKRKTGDEIEKLSNLIPTTATVLKNEREIILPVSEIQVGDIVVLRVGDYSPIDGVVVNGHGAIDKSAITGESIPEEVFETCQVLSGSIMKTGLVYVKAEKVGENTLFSEIVETVKNAGASKAPVQKLADKISAYFVPAVTLISIITFVLWITLSGDLYLAFKYAISVLVISCPCALGLATPVAIMATTGRAASMGVLYKNAETIQKLAKVNCVLFDKTATLTVGKPKVTDFINLSTLSDEKIKGIVTALEKNANHPLATAMIEFCGQGGCVADNVENVIGKGVVGVVNLKKYYLGNFNGGSFENLKGKTVITLADEENTLAVFALSDEIKPNSFTAVKMLDSLGVKSVMVTGDNKQVATLVADKLNIQEYAYSVLPNGKADIVKEYKQKGYCTAFCGDGINDSPALSCSDVGIAVGTGTDIAIDTASVVISGEIICIANAVNLSRKAVGVIKGNLFWAFFYNVLFIPVAAGATSFIGLSLSPIIASALMCVSSLCVVLNALRIRKIKKLEEKLGNEGVSMKVKIDGMMCKHCEKKVYDTLTALTGVEKVEINLKKKLAVISGEVEETTVTKAIEDAGYSVISINK